IILKNGTNIRDTSRKIQYEVARAISEMVGMQVGRVNIHIEDIDYPTEIEA
ncbi:MAG: Asp23/Gls24 family envelope stress response protein, partial [Chloroflexota bacterium]